VSVNRFRVIPVLVSGALWAAPAGAARVVDVRVGTHPDYTRVVLELDGPAGYRLRTQDLPSGQSEVVIELEADGAFALAGRRGLVESVRVKPQGTGSVALLRLKTANPRITETKLANPERIVIDVRPGTAAVARKTAAPRKTQAARTAEPAPKADPDPKPEPVRKAELAPQPSGGATLAPPADSMFEPGPPAPLLEDQIAEAEAWKPPSQGPAATGSAGETRETLPSTSAPPPTESAKAPTGAPAEIPPSQPTPGLASEEIDPLAELDEAESGGFVSALVARSGTVALAALIMVLLGAWLMLKRRAARPTREAYPRLPPLDEITTQERTFAEETADEVDAGLLPAPPFVEVAEEEPTVAARRAEDEAWPEPPQVEEEPMQPPPGPLFEPAVRVPPPAVAEPAGAPEIAWPEAEAGSPETVRILQEIERRLRHLEVRIDELADSSERIDRQLGSQGEELRVQRAAIARAQRVLRALTRPEDSPEATAKGPPLFRGPSL
jgi:hypothetical protein